MEVAHETFNFNIYKREVKFLHAKLKEVSDFIITGLEIISEVSSIKYISRYIWLLFNVHVFLTWHPFVTTFY